MIARGRVLAAVLLALGLLSGVAWALSSPLGSSPDDDYHMASIWCPPPAEGSGCNVQLNPDGSPAAVEVPRLLVEATCYAFKPADSAECQAGGTQTDPLWTARFDDGSYPGGFYRVMHLFVGADPARSVLAMRIANVAIAVALLGTVLAIAPATQRRIIGLAVAATGIPLGAFLVASVNPSSWAIVGIAVVWAAAVVHFAAAERWRQAVAGGLVVAGAGLAASARSDSGPMFAVLLAAVALVHLPALRERWQLGIAPLIALGIGAVSFLTSGQSGALTAATDTGRSFFGLLFRNLLELPSILAGPLGFGWGLGWLDTAMPAMTGVAMIAIVGYLFLTGLGTLWRRKSLAFAMSAVVLVLLPLYMLMIGGSVVGENVQPRYTMALLTGTLGVALVGASRLEAVAVPRGPMIAIAVLLAAANSAALHTNVRRYTVGLDEGGFNLDAAPQWWWESGPSPLTVWLLGTLAFAAVAASLVLLVRDSAQVTS